MLSNECVMSRLTMQCAYFNDFRRTGAMRYIIGICGANCHPSDVNSAVWHAVACYILARLCLGFQQLIMLDSRSNNTGLLSLGSGRRP